MKDADKLLEIVKFKDNGLIPAIVQDAENGEVLMLAYMNKEALKKTMETKISHFYSRSRKKIWKKGETSGHIQRVKEIYIDCDEDTILLKVEQKVGACHLGYRSCFFRRVEDGNLKIVGKKVFSEKDVYGG